MNNSNSKRTSEKVNPGQQNNSTNLAAALIYGKYGLTIFPILELTKDEPLVRWGTKATSDLDQIRKWWTRWPNAGIGLACKHSKIGVVDQDEKNGKSGRKTLDDIAALEGLDLTL